MSSAWNIDSIVGSFEEAALSPEVWPKAFDVLARETGSRGMVLLPLPKWRTASNIVMSDSVAESGECYFREGWNERDKRDGVLQKAIACGVATDLDMIGEDDMRRDPYYQDFLARFGLKWWAGVAIEAGGDHAILSMQRSPEQGLYTLTEQKSLAALGRRLRNAASLARGVEYARIEGLLEGLELAGLPAVLADRGARALRFNRSAEALFGFGIQISRGRIVASDPPTTGAIERAISSALGTAGAPISQAPVVIRREGRRPIVLSAVPLTGRAGMIFAPAHALVILRDLDAERVPAEAGLRAIFGLTRAEARMALSVAKSGDAVTAVAEQLGVSVPTARTQLAAVYRKTDSKGQADLIRLIMRLSGTCEP